MKRNPEFDPSRYYGKPFLMILDQFFLSAIIPPVDDHVHLLNSATEKIWKEKGDWKLMIIKHMEFDSNILEITKKSWDQNVERAEKSGNKLSPWNFAMMVSDHYAG